VATHHNHKYLSATFHVWYDKSNDNIHITSNDPDFKPDGMHVSVKKGTASDRTARAALARHGCPHSPGWREVEDRRQIAASFVLGLSLIARTDGRRDDSGDRTFEELLAAYQPGDMQDQAVEDHIERLAADDTINWKQLGRIMRAKSLEELSAAGAYQDDDDAV
jgi:hypothetical protein